MEAERRFQPEGASDEQQPTPGPISREEARTCRIEHWRGYVTSRFFVLTDDGMLLESKPFRWRREAPPAETKKARAAYDELVARLEAKGWTLVRDGEPWFATTFALSDEGAARARAPHHETTDAETSAPSDEQPVVLREAQAKRFRPSTG